ncbi:Protein PIR [Glycine soja]|uniref:Protein PIR n=1 Tax=Glycine soja TaxID=3848 RepID=A0A445ILZ8_GLYSO|nr:Protein PIR [Glycine soja]
MINLRSLITERMNKFFRENIEFLFDHFECQDLCAIVELEKLLDVLKHSHELLSRDLSVDSFSLMLNEMQENISLVSFSSRLASQITLHEPMITGLQDSAKINWASSFRWRCDSDAILPRKGPVTRAMSKRLPEDWARAAEEDLRVLMNLRIDF